MSGYLITCVCICNKVKSFFFRPAGRFRDSLARPSSAPLDSTDGESTGDPPAASLALALAPWPARRAPKVEKIESASRVAPQAPRGRAGDVKPALGDRHPRKKKVQSIPYIYPTNSDLRYVSSRNTPHVDVTRESHPSMCTHHAAAGSTQGGCRYVTTHGVAASYEFIYATSRVQHYCELFARRYKTLSVLDSLLARKFL